MDLKEDSYITWLQTYNCNLNACTLIRVGAVDIMTDSSSSLHTAGPATCPCGPQVPLLLVLATQNLAVPPFKPLFDALIHRKCHGLARRYPHDPRGDALVKSVHTFLFPHVSGDGADPAPCGLAGCARDFLQARFDRVDGGVAQRTHGATD